MPDNNPLSLLMPRKTNEDEETNRISQGLDDALKEFEAFVSGLRKPEIATSPERTATKSAQNEVNKLGLGIIRGTLMEDTPLPSETMNKFNVQFKQSYSPAREMLSNFIRGFSATATGSKFQSLREQKFQEFTADQQAKADQQKKLSDLSLKVMGEIRLQQALQQEADYKDLDSATDWQDYITKQRQFVMTHGLDALNFQTRLKEFSLNTKKAALEERKFEQPSDPQDALFKSTRADLEGQGVDLSTPQGQKQLQDAAFERFKAYQTWEAKNKKSETMPSFTYTDVIDIAGNPIRTYKDRTNPMNFGAITSGGIVDHFLPANTTAAQRTSFQAGLAGINNMRTAIDAVQSAPNFGGLKGEPLALKLRNLFGEYIGIEPKERDAIIASVTATMDYLKQKSGVQFSDRERVFMTQAMPQTINNQEDFFNAALAISGVMYSGAIMSQYPQLYARIDPLHELNQLKDAARAQWKKGNWVELPTYEKFVEQLIKNHEAKGEKFQVIRDPRSNAIIGVL